MSMYKGCVQAHIGKEYVIAADNENQAKSRCEHALIEELYGTGELNEFDWSHHGH